MEVSLSVIHTSVKERSYGSPPLLTQTSDAPIHAQYLHSSKPVLMAGRAVRVEPALPFMGAGDTALMDLALTFHLRFVLRGRVEANRTPLRPQSPSNREGEDTRRHLVRGVVNDLLFLQEGDLHHLTFHPGRNDILKDVVEVMLVASNPHLTSEGDMDLISKAHLIEVSGGEWCVHECTPLMKDRPTHPKWKVTPREVQEMPSSNPG
jgi:hypothetical protein